MSDDVSDARKELEKEYAGIRKDLDKIREAMAEVEQAGPQDEIYELLGDLESAVSKVRKGGMLGSGAKAHRKALARFNELTGPVDIDS